MHEQTSNFLENKTHSLPLSLSLAGALTVAVLSLAETNTCSLNRTFYNYTNNILNSRETVLHSSGIIGPSTM